MWSKLFLGVFFSIFFGIFNPVKGAETIEMTYTPLSFSLDISSLENFANTGEINAQLRQYTKSLDKESLAVNQLSNLSAEDLTASYGKNPPVAIIPPRLNPPDSQSQSIIDDIKSKGVLKVAFPQNTPPFGFVDGEGRWGGYCGFLTREFTTYLQEKLNLDFELNISHFPVSSTSNFNLVKNNQVHFECGTNVIDSQQDKVAFSVPFFVTGNKFLVSNTSNLNPNQSLNNYNIAVVKNSRHNNFIRAKYPQAKTTFKDCIFAIYPPCNELHG
ncbi:MAG: transporter substrate-binding domain-containing protein [Cyanobacterium sp. T60_A2020_053]|nr:transporter substrate-binding domain-containing protein [Cyanobacterium sp. T60_A2020_053]